MTQIIEQPLTKVENNEKLYYSSAVKHYKQLLEALRQFKNILLTLLLMQSKEDIL